MSLNMLIEAAAGFDHTGAVCRRWMEEAGFQNGQVQPLQGPCWAAIGRK